MISRIAIGFLCIEAIVLILSFFVAFMTHEEMSRDNIPVWGVAAVLNIVAVCVGLLYLLTVGVEFAFTGMVNW